MQCTILNLLHILSSWQEHIKYFVQWGKIVQYSHLNCLHWFGIFDQQNQVS